MNEKKSSLLSKFLIPTISLIIGVVIIGMFLLSAYLDSNISENAIKEKESSIKSVIDNLKTTDALIMEQVNIGVRLLQQETNALGNPSLGNYTTIADRRAPNLLFGETPMANNFRLVDRIKDIAGGTATIFVRDGSEFVRITTNVQKSDGSRAIGTILNPNGRAYAKIIDGKPYYGFVNILGNPYLTAYVPILSSTNRVIGIWYTGYKINTLEEIGKNIGNAKILENGFVALVNEKNEIVFHSNHLSAESIDDIISAYKKGEDIGWNVSETDYESWGYQIYAAFDEDEVNAQINAARFSVIGAGLIILIVLTGFLYYIIKKVIISPITILDEASNRMLKGDDNVKVEIDSDNEIGKLASSFNEMAVQIQRQLQYLNFLPTPVMLIDPDFNIQYMNKAGASLTEKLPKDVIGMKCYQHFKTQHCETKECACFRAKEEGQTISAGTIAKPMDTEIPIAYTGTPVYDENGKLYGILEVVTDITETKEMEQYLTRSTTELLNAVESFAQGDLTISVKNEREGDDIDKLYKGFNKAVLNIRQMVISVSEAAQATASAAEQISGTVEELSAASQEQSAQTNDIAGAIQQMAATIIETTKQAASVAESAKEAGDGATEGGNIVSKTVESMNSIVAVVENAVDTVKNLGESSEKIGEIIEVINDIADQTNLLALNAAIEAARAGEHGRGFAVVADEVRKLAERTTKATKEIAAMIEEIQGNTSQAVSSIESGREKVETGKKLAEGAGTSMKSIVGSANNVSDMITQVVTANEQQSAAAEQISNNIESINHVSQESANGIQQVATSAQDLSRLTLQLQQQLEKFRLQ